MKLWKRLAVILLTCLLAFGASAEGQASAKWNEKKCDHANINCKQAPDCNKKKGCQHIGKDVHGNEKPLCQLGRWVLDQQDKLQRQGKLAQSKSIRAETIDLDKGNATIYRSGTYTIKGGENRKGATITVAADRLVVLRLREVTLEKINLQKNVHATVQTTGVNTAENLVLGKNVTLQFTMGGSIVIDKTEQDKTAKISVTGGSVQASFKEKAGRTAHRFKAAGVTAVTIDGEDYPANAPNAKGYMHLWLADPGAGSAWRSEISGSTLVVTRDAAMADDTVRTVVPGQTNVLDQPGLYTLSGDMPAGTLLRVTSSDVTIRLDGATANLSAPLIEAQVACTVSLKGHSTITGAALASGKKITLAGSGTAAIDEIGTSVAFSCGEVTLGSLPSGYVAMDCPVDPAGCQLTIDGKKATLVRTSGGKVAIPAPATGTAWTLTAEGKRITVRSRAQENAAYDLSVTPRVKTGAAKFSVDGKGVSVTATNKATATFRSVRLSGSGAVLTAQKDLTVRFSGKNQLHADNGNAVSVKNGAQVKLTVSSGRLSLQQKKLTNITLKGNIRVEPAADGCTIVTIVDNQGQPVANADLTVRIADKTYEYTTFADGTLRLWGLGNLKGQAIAASDGSTVYTAVLPAPAATPAPRRAATPDLRIENVQAADQPDGSIRVTFTAEGAGSAGVMYITGSALADDYVSGAKYAPAQNGAATLTGVEPGATILLRVYATEAEDVELTAQSADGFKFSGLVSHSHRAPYTASGVDAVYTGQPYECPITLPASASVAYDTPDVPVSVGAYTMHVTIPQGDQRYLPGTYDIPFNITKIPLIITPDPNQQKTAGEADPAAYTYTVKGLLPGDEITGELRRAPGEDPGNYDFLLDGFTAPAYYELQLPRKASVYTILPLPSLDAPVFYEMLHPVRQEIVRKDGRKVAVVLNTQDSMTVTYSRLGEVIYATADDRQRPFSPSLVWNEDADEVLLRIRTEAELNKDGGYATDDDGHPVWGGRYMRMSWLGFRTLHNIGVDAVSLSCHGAALTLRVEDLLSQAMQDHVKSLRGDLKTARFRLTVEPTEEAVTDAEIAAADALRPVTRLWRVNVTLILDREEYDVTGLIPSLTVSVAMDETQQLLEMIGRYDEAAFPGQYQLYALHAEDTAFSPMDSAYVRPYMPDEMTLADFPAAMYTQDYLLADVGQAGVVAVALRR